MSASRYLYLIHCIDDQSCGLVDKGVRFGGSVKRMNSYTEHKQWQGETSNPSSNHFIKKISAGPLESEDGKYMLGSCFIVESTREEAEAFIHDDPFYKAGVWERVSIHRYISIPNGIKPVSAHKEGDDITTVKMVVQD